MAHIFKVGAKNPAVDAWKDIVFTGPLWLKAADEVEARQKAADKSFLMGLRLKRPSPLRGSPWIDSELATCERDEHREGVPEVGIVIADGRLLGNDEPPPWRWINFARDQLNGPTEQRIRSEFSARLKAAAQVDPGVVYWRAEANASRTYYFSPDAAALIQDILTDLAPNFCIAPDVQHMLREGGFQAVRW
jgi:hypothetical protein